MEKKLPVLNVFSGQACALRLFSQKLADVSFGCASLYPVNASCGSKVGFRDSLCGVAKDTIVI